VEWSQGSLYYKDLALEHLHRWVMELPLMLASQPAVPPSLRCFLLCWEALAEKGAKFSTFRRFAGLRICKLRLLTPGQTWQGMVFIWAVLQPCTLWGGVSPSAPPQHCTTPSSTPFPRLTSELHGLAPAIRAHCN